MTSLEEDRQFLAQQRMDRSGSIGGIDSLAALERQSEERRGRREQLKVAELESLSTCKEIVSELDEITDEETSDVETFTYNLTTIKKQRIISSKLMQFLTEQTQAYARHQ